MQRHSATRVLLVLCAATLVAPATATTLLFDFGNTGQQTLIAGWNNLTYPDPNPAPGLASVVDSTGAVVPGVTLEFTDQFFINGPPSQLGSESPSGDAAAYPVSATDDYFFGHTGPFAGAADDPTGGFKLTGLAAGVPHNFTFMSSRTGVGDSRETAYEVVGANSASGLLEASNNNSNVLRLNGIVPDGAGEIAVTVSAGPNNNNGSRFYYINLMQVDVVPEPATGATLTLAVVAMAARRRVV